MFAKATRRKLLHLGAASGAAAVGTAILDHTPHVMAQTNPLLGHAHALASQSSKINEVLKRGHVIVGTGSQNPPWHSDNAQGTLIGMDIAMGQILSTGLFSKPDRVQFLRQDADARVPNLLSNKVDIVIQFMTVNALRAQLVAFSIPYYTEADNFLFLANSPYSSNKSLIGHHATISGLQNVDLVSTVKGVVPDATILALPSQGSVILALETGRAQAAFVDLSTTRYLSQLFPKKFKASHTPFNPNNYAAAMAPTDQLWINFVNTVFREAITGLTWQSYAAAFKTYFGVSLRAPSAGLPEQYGNRG